MIKDAEDNVYDQLFREGREMSYTQQNDPWLQDAELPSWTEHEDANSGGTDFEDDELEFGNYQFAIVDRSPLFDDQFNPGKQNVNLKFVVVHSEDPADLGKKISQWFKVSSHPMADLYSLFKAAAGGHIDPNTRPKLADLHGAQFKAVWNEKNYTVEGRSFTKLKIQAFMPARTTYPVPAYQ